MKIAYSVFAKKRQKMQAIEKFLSKKQALKLMKRGLKWRQKNLSLLQGDVSKYESVLKEEFENRI